MTLLEFARGPALTVALLGEMHAAGLTPAEAFAASAALLEAKAEARR